MYQNVPTPIFVKLVRESFYGSEFLPTQISGDT